jgi:hypothetical protein
MSRSRLFLELGAQDSSPLITSFSYSVSTAPKVSSVNDRDDVDPMVGAARCPMNSEGTTYRNGQGLGSVKDGLLPVGVLLISNLVRSEQFYWKGG